MLRTGGTAIVRTTFRERLDAVVHDYWPRLRAIDERRFPGEEERVADFVSAGFTPGEVTSFAQPVAADLVVYHARLVGRPKSKFTRLTPRSSTVASSDRRRRRGQPRCRGARPVLERYDVAVFSRS